MSNLIYTISIGIESENIIDEWISCVRSYGDFDGDIIVITDEENELEADVKQITINKDINNIFDIKKLKFEATNHIDFNSYDKIMCSDLDIIHLNNTSRLFKQVTDDYLYCGEEYPETWLLDSDYVGGTQLKDLITEEEQEQITGLPRFNNGIMIGYDSYLKYCFSEAVEMINEIDSNIQSDQKVITALTAKDVIKYNPLYRDSIIHPLKHGYRYFTSRTNALHYNGDDNIEDQINKMQQDYTLLQEIGKEKFIQNKLSVEEM